MAFKKGERYRCPDAECGCEIEVTKLREKGATSLHAVAVEKKCRRLINNNKWGRSPMIAPHL